MNRRGRQASRRGLAALSLGLLLFDVAASEPNPAQDVKLKSKMSAILRIEIEYLDDEGNRKAQPDRIVGHGVYISARGLVLTASHVLYPDLEHFTREGASDYRIAVRSYQTRREIGGGEVAYLSPPVRFGSAVVAQQSRHSLEDRFVENCKAGSDAICLKRKPSATNDIAVFATRTSGTPYIGLSGPKERISRLVQQRGDSLSVGVLSDFDANDSISFSPVYYKSDNEYETQLPQVYRAGVSGSPVVVHSTFPEAFDTLFVVGVIVQAPDVESGNQKVFVASKNDLPEFETNSELVESLGVSKDSSYEGWHCFDDPSFPRPNPLHGDYLALKLSIAIAEYSNILDLQHTGELIDCGLRWYGWQDSFEDVNEDFNERMNNPP